MIKHEIELDPLSVLEEIASDALGDPRARVAAAKSLAEYTHQKKPPVGLGTEAQQVNIVMLLGEGKKTCLPST
jgi:hypothetical protein